MDPSEPIAAGVVPEMTEETSVEISAKTGKPKRVLTEAQKLAFQKGREKRAAELERRRQAKMDVEVATAPSAAVDPLPTPQETQLLQDIMNKLNRLEERMTTKEDPASMPPPKLRLKRAKIEPTTPTPGDFDEPLPNTPPVPPPMAPRNSLGSNVFNWI